MVSLSCCCNYATEGHIGMQIFNFIVSSVIIAHQCSYSSHCLFLHLMYVNSNLIDAQKTLQEKWEAPLRGGWKTNSPTKPQDILNGSPSLHRVMHLPNAVQSKKDFASDA